MKTKPYLIPAVAIGAIALVTVLLVQAASPKGTGLSNPVFTNFNALEFPINLSAVTTNMIRNLWRTNTGAASISPSGSAEVDMDNAAAGTMYLSNMVANIVPVIDSTKTIMPSRTTTNELDLLYGKTNLTQHWVDSGTADASIAGSVGIGTNGPSAPVHVGNYQLGASVDPQVLVSRTVDDTVAGNGHAFADNSIITRSGGIGYAAFDSQPSFSGSQAYDHFVSFQSAPTYDSSGIIKNLYNLYCSDNITDGTVTNIYGVYFANPAGAATIKSVFGLYIAALTKGTDTNWGIYNLSPSNYYSGRTIMGLEGNPSALLHLAHPAAVGAHTNILLIDGAGGTSVGKEMRMAFTTLGPGYPLSYIGSAFETGLTDSYLSFGTRTSSAVAEKMRLSAVGNLGISVTSPTSRLHVAGSFAESIAVGTGATLGETNDVYLCNVAGQTVTLPAASGKRGRKYEVWAISPATGVTLAPTGSDLLNGANANITGTGTNKLWLARSDGTNWWVTMTTAP